MQVKTILNRLQKHRGFVYGTVQLEEQIAGLALTVEIAPHRRNRPRCASCGQASAVYDRLALRRFEFVPLWGLRVFFLYPMRRVDCPRCGVTVERVPWADGKHQLTTTYMWFLARWAKCLSWQEVARVFRTSWDQVFRSVAMAVAWGRDHVDLTGIRAIGIDEIHWQRGSQFLTLVYQIDPTRKRLLWIGQHRRAKTAACSGSSAGSDGSGPPRSLSSAATCGRRISKSSPRRPGMPSTSWTGFNNIANTTLSPSQGWIPLEADD